MDSKRTHIFQAPFDTPNPNLFILFFLIHSLSFENWAVDHLKTNLIKKSPLFLLAGEKASTLPPNFTSPFFSNDVIKHHFFFQACLTFGH